MRYEDRYTDDSHGMAEPVTLLKERPSPRLKIDNGSTAPEPFAGAKRAIDFEDEASEEEQRAYLQMLQEGADELVPFMVYASSILTRLAARSQNNALLGLELNEALTIAPSGFLALTHKLDANVSNFHQALAEFRKARKAAEAAEKASPGPSP